jgi:GAF domain-containing protein
MSRWSELADLLREASEGEPVAAAVCAVAARVLDAERAAIALVTTEGIPAGVVGTDTVATALVEEELLLGEGPSVRALAVGSPVVAVDLADAAVAVWPLYARAATAAGVAGVVAIPLRVGAVSLGVLVGLRARPGPPTPAAYADALVVADLAVHALLEEQAAGPGGVPASFTAAGPGIDLVHQATGMVAEQLGVPLGEALVRIRAHAFAAGLTAQRIARDIVDGTLVLEG